MLTWHQAHPGGRIVARLGAVEVGAVFPDPFLPAAHWRFFMVPGFRNSTAPTVDRAKSQLATRIHQWLASAELQHKPAKTTQDRFHD